jgi:hypothetical protein
MRTDAAIHTCHFYCPHRAKHWEMSSEVTLHSSTLPDPFHGTAWGNIASPFARVYIVVDPRLVSCLVVPWDRNSSGQCLYMSARHDEQPRCNPRYQAPRS